MIRIVDRAHSTAGYSVQRSLAVFRALCLIPALSSCIVTYDFTGRARSADPPSQARPSTGPTVDYSNPPVANDISYHITLVPTSSIDRWVAMVLPGAYPASTPSGAGRYVEAVFRDPNVFSHVTVSDTPPQTGLHFSIVISSHHSDLMSHGVGFASSKPPPSMEDTYIYTGDLSLPTVVQVPRSVGSYHLPSSPVAVALITGLSSLFIPYASDRAGYSMEFNMYRDGVLLGTYPYEIRKQGVAFLWGLPFVWLNLFMDSQEETIKQAVYHFIRTVHFEAQLRYATSIQAN